MRICEIFCFFSSSSKHIHIWRHMQQHSRECLKQGYTGARPTGLSRFVPSSRPIKYCFVSCCLEIFIIILCCNCFVFVILRYHGIYWWHHVLSCLKPHPQPIQWLYTIFGLKPHHQHTRNIYGNVLFVTYKMFVRWVLFQACENRGNGVNMPFDSVLLKHVISVICHSKI